MFAASALTVCSATSVTGGCSFVTLCSTSSLAFSGSTGGVSFIFDDDFWLVKVDTLFWSFSRLLRLESALSVEALRSLDENFLVTATVIVSGLLTTAVGVVAVVVEDGVAISVCTVRGASERRNDLRVDT